MMMQYTEYTEQGYTTPLNTSIEIEDTVSPSSSDHQLSLTPLWEYIIHAKCLPESLDLDNFFSTVHERLHNPEWEVRQHALRVLVDFIPLIPTQLLDIKLQIVLPDLVTNLGHLGPAVRKGAVDSLRSYVNHTEKTDEIIRNLVENGIENAQQNKIHTNVVLGIILSLPYLINNKINDSTIKYVVHRLLDKIVKVIHQETVLRSLLRIREIIGYDKFDDCLLTHETYNSKTDFDLLCEVYDLHIFKTSSRTSQYETNNKNNSYQYFKINKYNNNVEEQKFVNNVSTSADNESTHSNKDIFVNCEVNNDYSISSKDSTSSRNELDDASNDYQVSLVSTTYFKTEDVGDFDSNINLDEDTVILETEIQLNSGSAITMKIHEESTQNSLENEDKNRNQTFKVLPDYDPKDYDYLRRTPRRVRFGGEIIKLRTPDSDSNLPSDDDPIISITSENEKPVIEIKYIENETKITTRTSRIPIPLKQTQSAPNSPHRNILYKSKIYKSSPNLSKTKRIIKLDGKSRIPRRFNTEVKKSIETKIQIKISEKPKKSMLLEKPKNTFKSKLQSPRNHARKRSKSVETLKPKNVMPVNPMPRRNSREDEFSPIPVHNEIEVLHNLTRTPSPNLLKTVPTDQLNIIKIADAFEKNLASDLNKVTSNIENPFTSFQVYNSSFSDSYYEFADSPIPTKDTGECLTCSSSGSDTVSVEKKTLTGFGVLNAKTVEDLQNMDDIRARQRGLEELLRVMQTPSVIDSLEERLPTLLYILFSAEQQPILQQIAEQSLSILFTSMNQQALVSRLHQIALNLSKTGSPLGVRLAILLMRRIPPRLLVDQLLADPILGAKSSKVREGALQILMTVSRIFPSTDINIPKSVKSVAGALKDKKRKVRQAALEALAALAQLSSPSMVVDVATEVTSNWTDQDQILKVIRTRLSRKQLPTVNMNGSIRYSTPNGESEIEWLSRGSGTHSPHLSYSQVINPTKLPEVVQTNNLPNTEIKQISQSQESTSFSDNQIQKDISADSVITKPINQTQDNQSNKTKRFLSAQKLSETIDSSLEINGNNILNQTIGDVTELYNKESPRSNRFVNNDFEETQLNSASTNKSDSIGTKRSFWRSNSRHQMLDSIGKSDEIESDWSRDSREEPIGQSTQIWAIDPTSLKTEKKLTNDPLRQVYIVNKNTSKSAATNTPSTNFTSVYRKPPRGRSFSPPASKHSDYDSYDEHERVRFVNSNYERETRRYRRELRARKSYSSEHLSNEEKLRIDREDSESSSGSSIRHTGNWQRDLRSGIPVPVATESKLRIRNNRPSKIPKGPLSTPYSFPRVKSPSPHSTPDKFTIPQIIGRQPFSSGSESSGYFTPPAEPLLHESSPQHSPVSAHRNSTVSALFGSPNPPRFIQIESPKHFEENFTIIDSEHETFDDEDTNIKLVEDVVNKNEHNLERKNTATSLDELSLHDTNTFAECSLSKNEIKSVTNSLDEIDFTQITFSENRALSKSEVDIKISRQYSRKNVSSAPAIADINTNFEDIPTNTVKTSLPGSVVDSLEDTEAPENLIIQSPHKKSATQIIPKSSVRRKTGRVANNSTIYPDNLKPFPKPREGLHETFTLLESSEWENMMQGLNGLVRLIRHHPEIVENQMHAVCVILGKHVRNLRSQVARAACLASSEMFGTFKRSLEVELDELAYPLLQRTADTNKFLRSDANAALDEMSANMSLPKVIATVSYRGAGHQNAVVRCAAARLLCNIVHRLGPEKVFQLPKDTRDKILLCGANMLTEGSLDTRKHAKMLLGHLATHCQFQRAMVEAVPNSILRHIEKQLRALT